MKGSSVLKDVRALQMNEVVTLSDWLTKYRRLEDPEVTDGKQLLNVLVRSTREYEGDFGVFTSED